MKYNRLSDYSKAYLSFQSKLIRLAGNLLPSVLLAILIYLGTVFLEGESNREILILFIATVILINFFLYLAKEKKELKVIKKQQKIYAKTFLKLHDDYEIALRDIRARDEFLSIVSHELKTPLTIMLLKIHSELNNIRNSPLANFSVHGLVAVLNNSEKQIESLKSIVNNLLDISAIRTGRMTLKLEDIDLASIAKQVNMSFSEVLKKEKYKVKMSAKSPVVGKWDKVRIEQVITNLFSNAIKYGEGKPIDIKIFKSGRNAKFIISDRGIGITPSEQKVIFDLFKRAPGSEYKPGLGVGLFITSQIVKIHSGKMKVTSIPGKGTSFTIELPLK